MVIFHFEYINLDQSVEQTDKLTDWPAAQPAIHEVK